MTGDERTESAGPDDVALKGVERAAAAAGLGALLRIEALTAAGANNRAYRARIGARDVFVKQYFRPPAPAHDRLGAEWAFARFAWAAGAHEIAEPLAADEEAGVALFAWVEGQPIGAATVEAAHIEAALTFLDTLTAARDTPAAAGIGTAAEACFSLAEHLALVGSRVSRLAEAADEPARAFVHERLAPAWSVLEARVRTQAAAHGIDADVPLAPPQRCLSPSDFGFHNALVRADGAIVFHDFEYAGWDDPAKLVGDFLAQVAVPVGESYALRFVDRVASVFDLDDRDRARVELLRPVYRLKWCCIVLNELLPADRERREFAARDAVTPERKGAQLAKAESMLAALASG